ncbi:MAG: phosphatidylglycerophosphatase A [Candidatus Omnitrophota bacterium]|jgi:phosphatidylglycerophosphatase A
MRIAAYLVKATATFFGLGYLPFMPGTFASLAGFLIFVLIGANSTVYVLVAGAVLVVGFLACGRAEEIFKRKDSSRIVIDEVGGMLVALLCMPYDLKIAVLAFVLFRILDITKPFPANGLQRFRGSLGVMADDIVSGLYANLILQLALRFTFLRGS